MRRRSRLWLLDLIGRFRFCDVCYYGIWEAFLFCHDGGRSISSKRHIYGMALRKAAALRGATKHLLGRLVCFDGHVTSILIIA
jgi:hypothetical protein